MENLSIGFYQLIPHKFPQKKMLVLDSEPKVFAKIELLNLINDIQITYGLNEEEKQLKAKQEKERREKEKRELEELEKQKKKLAAQKDPKKKVEKEKEKEAEPEENKEEQKPEEEVIVIEDVKNFYDRNYENLHCKIETLSRSTKQFELVSQYLDETLRGITGFYTCEVLNIFKLNREADKPPEKVIEVIEEKHPKEKEKETKKKGKAVEEEPKHEPEIVNPPVLEYSLLMYGCKISNLTANLSKGLRLPHPAAPMKAYKLGKGIYFSDTASKSTNFCYSSVGNDVGFLILCTVDLGTPLEKMSRDFEINQGNLPKGKKSVKGIGRITPKLEVVADLNELDEEKCKEDPPPPPIEEGLNQDGIEGTENKPLVEENSEKKEESHEKKEENHAKIEIHEKNEHENKENEQKEQKEMRYLKIPSGELQPSDCKDSTFLYNEYVVFDEKQVKVRYLVKLKFNYK